MKKDSVSPIRIGLVGAGYMGKRHAVALKAVGTVFNTKLRPICEVVCTTTPIGAAEKACEFGFNRSTGNWHDLIDDPAVDAIIIASPQETHRKIAIAAIGAGKAVFCEKPLGASLDDARTMTEAAEQAGVPNMFGFNYIRTPQPN
jgi:predicted dehydrogenase